MKIRNEDEMTTEEWNKTGIFVEGSSLYLDAGLEWLKEHSTISCENSIETVKALPNKVKLFLMEFSEIMQRETGIASEGISGISQSFQNKGKETLIWDAAKCLLKEYLKSNVTVLPAKRRWK